MKTIYYVGAYRTEHIAERIPQGSVAEDAKMAYVISTIKKLGLHITIVSVLSALNRGYHKRKTCRIDAQETQTFLESFDEDRIFLSKLGVLYRLSALFFYLLTHVNEDDTVIVYNAQLYSIPVRLAKFVKKFIMILEIEEIFYLDDRNSRDVKRKNIEEKLICSADKYIVVNSLLKRYIPTDRECIVLYGAYAIPPIYSSRNDDGNTHVVYAGGIDSLRRVDLAIEAFLFLPDNYHFHILGYGTDEAVLTLQKQIEAVNHQVGYQKVEYMGCLHGCEYDKFLQSCHIGLNVQFIGASIEDVAFPSKISSYLSRGLNIVSGRLSSVSTSPFAQTISFYDENNPQAIAKAIYGMEIHDYQEQIQVIKNIDAVFFNEFKELLECQ